MTTLCNLFDYLTTLILLIFSSKIEILGASIPDWLLTATTIVICIYNYKLWETTAKQIKDTEESLKISKQSADASKKMVSLIEANTAKELRAYISITPKGIKRTSKSFTIRMEIQNHGKTPAYNLNIKSKYFIKLKNFDFDKFPINYRPHAGKLTINPTEIFNAVTDDQETPETTSITMVSESTGYLFIAAIAYYNDVFGNNYSTEILVKTSGVGFLGSWNNYLDKETENSLQWEYCDTHNKST